MRRFFRWVLRGLLAVAVVIVLAYGAVYLLSQSRINQAYEIDPSALKVAVSGGGVDGGEAGLEWGKHIAETRGCGDCHGEGLGGGLFADAMPVFRLFGSNLTPAGVGDAYEDADWVRAIRHGVGADGKPLLFMPSYEYYYLSDEDLGALVEYLKSLPPIQRSLPENEVGPLGRILFLTGKLPLLAAEMIDHEAPRPAAPPRGATAEYGRYLAVGCTGCHGPEFSGGVIPGVPPEWPPAANLTPDPETGIGGWSREDFLRAVTQGVRPDGSTVDSRYMPWPNLARLEADELEALWLFLRTVKPKPVGGR